MFLIYVNGQLVPGHHNDVATYKRLCDEYGVHPRFWGTQVSDKDGNMMDVTDHPGYIKLIKETARTDNEQKPIEFNFGEVDEHLGMSPMDYAMKALNEFASRNGFKGDSADPMSIVNLFDHFYPGKNREIGWMPEGDIDSDDPMTSKFYAVLEAGEKAYREMYDGDTRLLDADGYQKALLEGESDVFNQPQGNKNTATEDGVQFATRADNGYNQIRERLAKKELDKLSDRLGEQFPLSSRFESYIESSNDVVSSPTVTAGSVQRGARSFYKAAKDTFINSYSRDETANMAGTGIVVEFDTDSAGESMSKLIGTGDEQILLDIIPLAKGMVEGGKLLGIERLSHTSNKNGGLFAYRVYNVFDYSEFDTQTNTITTEPCVFVATVVQEYFGNSVLHIIRGIEIATADQGKLAKSEESLSTNGGKYKISSLYEYVKSVPRENGGLKYNFQEELDYKFQYTKTDDGKQYSVRNTEYLELAKDPEKNDARLRELVAEAAADAGYATRAYHGSPVKGITVFSRNEAGRNTGAYSDKAIWFSNDREFADSFSEETTPSTSGQLVNRTGNRGQTYDTFLNLGKTLDLGNLSNEEMDLLFGTNKFYKNKADFLNALNGFLEAGNQQGVKLYIDYDALAKAGYNSIKARVYTDYDVATGRTNTDRSTPSASTVEYGVFNSNQIKSADPVTYDGNGNVIPLSERFNTENEDIRYSVRGSVLTERDILRTAADAARGTDNVLGMEASGIVDNLTAAELDALRIYGNRLAKLDAAEQTRRGLLADRKALRNGREDAELSASEREALILFRTRTRILSSRHTA